jgi:hypothetical protein
VTEINTHVSSAMRAGARQTSAKPGHLYHQTMVFSHSQKVFMALGRFVGGCLSLAASSIVVYKIYRRFAESRGSTNASSKLTTYHRMLLGITFLDMLYAIGSLGGTFVIPASTGVVFGHGTTATCSAQGFLLQTGTALPVYIACLNIYFMLKIRYNIHDTIIVRRYEPWLHGMPVALAFSTASIGAALKLFNPINIPEMGCWIAPYPRGCSIKGHCTRGYKIGERLDMYVWVLAYAWYFASFLVVVCTSVLIYTAIRGLERRNALYMGARIQNGSFMHPSTSSSLNDATSKVVDGNRNEDVTSSAVSSQLAELTSGRPEPSVNMSEFSTESMPIQQSPAAQSRHTSSFARKRIQASRIAAVQSGLYCFSTLFTAIWIFMPWLGWKIGSPTKVRVWYTFMACVVPNLQGLFNLFIFVRLQYNHLRETEKEWSRLKCIIHCLTSPAANK